MHTLVQKLFVSSASATQKLIQVLVQFEIAEITQKQSSKRQHEPQA